MHKTYEIRCPLTPQATSARIERLLSQEGVEFDVAELRIRSTKTPLVVLGVESRTYTHRNWVGLNPFGFITGIDVQCEAGDGTETKVNVCINRRRALLWVAFWVFCGYLVARAMPQPAGGFVVVVLTCVAWLGLVSFLGGYLVKKEIGDALKG